METPPRVHVIWGHNSGTIYFLVTSTKDATLPPHVFSMEVMTKKASEGYFLINGPLCGLSTQKTWNAMTTLSQASLQWRHNERQGVSNHQPHDCLLNRLFRRRSKKTSKFCVTGLCEGNSPVTGEFPAQRASNAEKVPIWWRHHVQGHMNKRQIGQWKCDRFSYPRHRCGLGSVVFY